ncbi:MAG: hypothetical protein ACI85K_003783 [Hyphomicrobiaceae bacterium]|jgi:hypothetical protein
MLNTIILALALLCGAILLSRRIRDNVAWRATVTPLASIIGSGFLVVVPLLGNAVGGYAPIAMMSVVVLAFAVGAAIRFNIKHLEPLVTKSQASLTIVRLDRASAIVLGFAYFISVAFYLRLLASFALRGLEIESELLELCVTTAILAFLGIAGWIRGLSFLERLEEYSVSIKLAIIAALVFGWAAHDVTLVGEFDLAASLPKNLDWWHVVRLMAGVLIVVQGFETSRYLGREYSPELRVVTMRRAQIISALIYVVFVSLTVPSFHLLGQEVSETAVIDLSRVVASILPSMLIVAAVMSQFSAAVADTIGTEGLLAQALGKRWSLPANSGYVLVAVVGIALVWSSNIFAIIALASRAFATYYALQCLLAAMVASGCAPHRRRQPGHALGFAALAILLLVAAVIAVPAG